VYSRDVSYAGMLDADDENVINVVISPTKLLLLEKPRLLATWETPTFVCDNRVVQSRLLYLLRFMNMNVRL